MNNSDISVWVILKHLFFGDFIRGTRGERSWSQARVILIWGMLAVVLMSLDYSVDQIRDFSMAYPTRGEVNLDEGMLYKKRIARVSYFVLEKDNGENIVFREEKTLLRLVDRKWFFDEDGKRRPLKAKVRWFSMPSGIGWIAELEVGGWVIASYDQRREGFEEWAQDHGHLYLLGTPLLILLLLVWFEVAEIKRVLGKDVEHG